MYNDDISLLILVSCRLQTINNTQHGSVDDIPESSTVPVHRIAPSQLSNVIQISCTLIFSILLDYSYITDSLTQLDYTNILDIP
jgi:hypothetical protein